jgi:hypothetical protein
MTSSNALKCVVSNYETTTNEVASRKPLNLNCSLTEKSLMCGSLNGQPIAKDNKLGEWS